MKAPSSFVLLDVDHFKQVNDTFGHRAGDLVLRELATACRRALRSPDSVAWVVSEERSSPSYTSPHRDRRSDGGGQSAPTERGRVDRAGVNTYGEGITVTVSIGLAEFESGPLAHPDNLDTLLERADKALYQAKDLGRNMVVSSKAVAERETVEPDHRTLRAVV